MASAARVLSLPSQVGVRESTGVGEVADGPAASQGRDAEPEEVDLQVDGVPGLQPQSFHHGKEHRQADGRGREDDMEAHREGVNCTRASIAASRFMTDLLLPERAR